MLKQIFRLVYFDGVILVVINWFGLSAFALAAGGKNLVFTNDYRYFFSEDNPQLLEFEALQDTYTKQRQCVHYVGTKSW